MSEAEGVVETLRDAHAELDDRDIIWFVNTGSGLVSNQATVSGGVERDVNELLAKVRSGERVLLIGKDGGIKSRESRKPGQTCPGWINKPGSAGRMGGYS